MLPGVGVISRARACHPAARAGAIAGGDAQEQRAALGLDAACGLEVGLRGGRRVEQREVEARREVLRGAGERAEPGVGVMTSPARYLPRILPPASRYAVANRQGRWKLRNGDSVPWAKADRDRLAAFHAGAKLLPRRFDVGAGARSGRSDRDPGDVSVPWVAVFSLFALAAVGLALGTWRLRRLEVRYTED